MPAKDRAMDGSKYLKWICDQHEFKTEEEIIEVARNISEHQHISRDDISYALCLISCCCSLDGRKEISLQVENMMNKSMEGKPSILDELGLSFK